MSDWLYFFGVVPDLAKSPNTSIQWVMYSIIWIPIIPLLPDATNFHYSNESLSFPTSPFNETYCREFFALVFGLDRRWPPVQGFGKLSCLYVSFLGMVYLGRRRTPSGSIAIDMVHTTCLLLEKLSVFGRLAFASRSFVFVPLRSQQCNLFLLASSTELTAAIYAN